MQGFGYKPMVMDRERQGREDQHQVAVGHRDGPVELHLRALDYAGYGAIWYAPVLAIAVNNASFSFPGWFSGEEIIDPTMTSATDCQTLCAAYDGCSYFIRVELQW